MDTLESIRQQAEQELRRAGQEHLLRFWSRLDELEKRALLDDISQVDWRLCASLVDRYVRNRPQAYVPQDIRPAEILPAEVAARPPARPSAPDVPPPHSARQSPTMREHYHAARTLGEAAIRNGEVAAFTVAGGQGTRLGYDGPKGAFPISPVRSASLFQLFAESLLGSERRYGRRVDWYIMTSPSNHATTQSFFAENGFFGLKAEQVSFFAQSQMPAFLHDGRAAMMSRARLALSPDGHGGSLRALAKNGCLQRMRAGGVRYISYFQVDNPLVHCIDPLFIGLHISRGSELSSKAVEKSGDRERVGNFCIADGKLQVIEYSDLPDALADAKNPDGSRRLNAGSIAIHVLSRDLVERLTAPGASVELPWHRADKAVAVIDESGNLIKPDKSNVVKLEMFVFDAIPLAQNPLVLYTDRAEEFSPVKNSEGGDSPATCRRDMTRRAARWLMHCGLPVPRATNDEPAHAIEVHPAFACDGRELCERLGGRKLDWSSALLLA